MVFPIMTSKKKTRGAQVDFSHLSNQKQWDQTELCQKARKLTDEISRITRESPLNRDFGLIDEIHHSIFIISNYLAWVYDQCSPKESERYLKDAATALTHLQTQLTISCECGYIDGQQCNALVDECKAIGDQLTRGR